MALAGLVVVLEANAQLRPAVLRHLRTVHARSTQCWGCKRRCMAEVLCLLKKA